MEQGPFIAAFASSNLGDVSPNTNGPRCQYSRRDCDMDSSTCPGNEACIASGPGQDMFESTRLIAEKLVSKAWVRDLTWVQVPAPEFLTFEFVHN